MTLSRFLSLGTALLVLSACSPGTLPAPTPDEVARAEAMRPADAALAERYERSCRVCHVVPGGAPLAGHGPSWQARLAQGDTMLLAHVRDGFNAMPPRGLCNDCSDDELRRLIAFMGQPQ